MLCLRSSKETVQVMCDLAFTNPAKVFTGSDLPKCCCDWSETI